ncbi:hypothetical protein H0H92_007196 [Tricholoma furcatifolium]|nr:hypothetical protein H0H92_007196 [Tricholoma furcatifolium]
MPLPPPPPPLSRNPNSSTEPSRHKIKKSRRFFSLPDLKSQSQPKEPSSQIPASVEPVDPTRLITLDSTCLDTVDTLVDKYKWAVVYENQRGMTLFSTPYYSRLSLLPSDPPPFTIPDVVSTSSKQTNISLDDYPLPDGTWRWVSKCWMIDMRSDTGEVQHDGFEYNWMFRTHNWRAEVGSLSAGGWVRRRRWIRLMMRPSGQSLNNYEHEDLSTPSVSTGTAWHRSSVGSSLSLSVQALDASTAWTGDDVDGNWLKCRSIMKYLGRDGRKIELWKIWLGNTLPSSHNVKVSDTKGKGRETEGARADPPSDGRPTERDSTFDNLQVPPREWLVSILRKHGPELLRSFVYSDSRAKFLELLAEEGLLYALDIELSTAIPGSGMDFWSYVDSADVISWISSPPVQAAIRTYVLSLSLSLGPSLVPFLTAFLTAKSSKKTSLHALRRVLRRELGFDGFAFAMTIAVGGGAALHNFWRIYDSRRKHVESKRKDLFAIVAPSPSQRTFLSYMMSSTFGILLLQAGRQRFHRSRKVSIAATSIPPTSNQISNTLDLTLLLLVRAVDCLVQNFIRTVILTQDDSRMPSDEIKTQTAKETVRTLTARVDALVFWACSSRIMWCFFYEPQRLPKSYVKWIATLANLDGRIIRTLRLIREGSWSYIYGSAEHSTILTKFSQELGHNPSWGNPQLLPAYGGATADVVWKAMNVNNRHGVGGLPCQLVHGSVGSSIGLNGSCAANSIIRGSMAFLEAIAIYLPVA